MMDDASRASVKTWSITGAVSLGVVVICTILVRDGVVSSPEQSVFRSINDLPDALETPMVAVQYAGVAFVPFVVASIAAVLGKWRLVIAALLVYSLKLLVEKVVLKEI